MCARVAPQRPLEYRLVSSASCYPLEEFDSERLYAIATDVPEEALTGYETVVNRRGMELERSLNLIARVSCTHTAHLFPS